MTKLKINGMNCEHCVNTVKNAIKSVNGVKNVWVSLEKNEAEFDADENLDIETVKKAVSESGAFSAEQ
jgi:copper chaperone CopZ